MNIFPARCFSSDTSRVDPSREPQRKMIQLSELCTAGFRCLGGVASVFSILSILFSGEFCPPALGARPDPPAHPFASIPIGPLGYRPIGSVYMLLRLSSLSLDFVDDTHLLFTFHYSRLMSREAEAGHDDQIIRGVVLEIPSGKVDATAEWRMHDRQQYLFPLGTGQFLLRRGGDIEIMGNDLVLHPYIHFTNHLEAVQISPDGKMLIAQSDLERHSQEKHKQLVEQAIANGENLPDEDVSIQMVRLDERNVLAEAKSENPVRLAVSAGGYVDHEQLPGNDWGIHFHSFAGKDRQFFKVHSTCAPAEDFISADIVLLNLCDARSADRYVTAVTTDGKEAWKGEWDGRFISPNLSFSSKGTDFAINWIIASHPVDAMFSLSDGDVQGQAVQVLGTATGHLLLSVSALPVSSAGQNFALSPDGSKLAVLNKGNIELYEVPADTAK